jgi:hypothetical protein
MKFSITILALVLLGQTSKTQPQPHPVTTQQQSNNDSRGAEGSPLFVKVLPAPKTKVESTQEQQDRQDQSAANWWMVKLTAVIGLIGLLQLTVFGLQAHRLRQTIKKMDEIAKGQTDDMKASIAQATRAALAMEKVSTALEATVVSTEKTIAISGEIANTQKLVTELGNRAYLFANFNAAIHQDGDHVFEAQTLLVNRGNTPAYDVTFRATVGILPSPIPDDFKFPLPDDTAGTSVSLIAPGLTKIITRSLPNRVPDEDVASIKRCGPPKCLAMWGIVNYRDAFKQTRYLKFAFTIHWIPWLKGKGLDKEGNPIPEQAMSYDTTHFNEAN